MLLEQSVRNWILEVVVMAHSPIPKKDGKEDVSSVEGEGIWQLFQYRVFLHDVQWILKLSFKRLSTGYEA